MRRITEKQYLKALDTIEACVQLCARYKYQDKTTVSDWIDANKSKLSTRTYNSMYNACAGGVPVSYIDDLYPSDCLKFRNFGRKSLAELVSLGLFKDC